jgi:hypothetical protein
MNHNELVNEVTKQLAPRFSPSVSLIKKRIEALIEVRLPISTLTSPLIRFSTLITIHVVSFYSENTSSDLART